jgi:AP endonuclease-2
LLLGWNTKLDARASNYGSRIDYILVTPGLLPWIADSDIQPDVFGSDHCPVYVDLHETIVNEKGETLYLKDLVNPPRANGVEEGEGDERPDPPKFATRYWDEFSGKQRSLKDFFGGGPKQKVPQRANSKTLKAKKEDVPSSAIPMVDVVVDDSKDLALSKAEGTDLAAEPIIDLTNSTDNSPVKPKRKTSSSALPKSNDTAKKRPKQPQQRTDSVASQSSLATFFRPPAPVVSSKNTKPASRTSVTPTRPDPAIPNTSRSPLPTTPDQDSDYLFAKALASAEEYTEGDAEDDGDVSLDQSQAVASWSSIFAKKVPPRCKVHNLPCKPFGQYSDAQVEVHLS